MASRRYLLMAAASASLLTAGQAIGWVVIDQNGVVNGDIFQGANAPPFLNAAPLGQASGAEPTPAPAFEPPIASSRVRRTLLQFDALVTDRAWDEAIDVVERLQTEHGTELMPTAATSVDDATIFEPIAARCQRLLTTLPPEGLAAYRRRVDGTARQWLDEGVAQLDGRRLRRVVDELLASSEGDNALLALGELALERGDTAAARRHWRRLHPGLWGPGGVSIGAALGDLAPSVSDEQLAEAWNACDRSVDSLPVYPDADTPLAEVLARLIVASLREGDSDRATVELRLLDALAPEATGRLAGREQPLAATLEAMLAAEDGRSGADTAPLRRATLAWTRPIDTEPLRPTNPTVGHRIQLFRNALGGVERRIISTAPERDQSPPPLGSRPLVADGWLVFTEGRSVRRLDLATGEERALRLPGEPETTPGETDQAAAAPVMVDPPPMRLQRGADGRFIVAPRGAAGDQMQQLRQALQLQAAQRAAMQSRQALAQAEPSVLAGSLAYADGVLYAVQQRPVASTAASRRNRRVRYSQSIIGIDLRSEDKLVFELAIEDVVEDDKHRFIGAPLVRGDRLYATLHLPGLRTRVSIACFNRLTGRQLWRTEIGSGQPSRGAGGGSPLAIGGDTLYVATGLGAVAALDADRGGVRWLSRYARSPDGTATAKSAAGCHPLGDRVLVAPIDSQELLALDAATGRTLWSAERPDPTATLAGASPGGVIVAGKRLASFDPLTGRRRFVWPESEHAGLRGTGQATVVGEEIYWPTRESVYVIDSKAGGLLRPPIDLSPVGGEGANLVAAGGRLVIAGNRAIGVLGPGAAPDRGTPEPRPLLSRRTGDATPQNATTIAFEGRSGR